MPWTELPCECNQDGSHDALCPICYGRGFVRVANLTLSEVEVAVLRVAMQVYSGPRDTQVTYADQNPDPSRDSIQIGHIEKWRREAAVAHAVSDRLPG